MLSGVRHTRSGIPVPLDPSGREMCLLFVKYGRCRFKSKCKRSHWTPPLPDEEYAKLPPLPPYPPPSASIGNNVSGRELLSHNIYMKDEQRHHSPVLESIHNQHRSTAFAEMTCGQTNVQNVAYVYKTLHVNQENVYQTQEVSPFSMSQHHPGVVLEYACGANRQVTMVPVVSCIDGVDMTLEKETQGLQSKDNDKGSAIDSKAVAEPTDTLINKIAEVLCKRKWRFDFVYNPESQARGEGWTYKSSIDQSYQQYGAYYDHVKKKLEFQNQPKSKVEKKNFKFLRRAHWNTCQELKARLAKLPPSYSLRVDLSGVNFSRLRPYFYLLVHQCFHAQGTTKDHWKPFPFSCLVAETLIALFASGNTSPAEAEKRMQDWCARPVRVRQCVSHMWSIIVKSSMSLTGVAREVLNCEQQVFSKKPSALDYAYACTLSGPLVKGDTRHFAHKHTPRIIQSVKQGIQAVKRKSLLQSKRTNLSPSTRDGNVNLGKNGRALSKTPGDGAETAKGATGKRKKRKRPQHLSLLDEQGKRDLFKRCRTILDDS
ncbi:unnamed protein product [Porites lobata]|uniref:C3H1-type domain-containing protein n=1 Tax=Porites lobata TaxID=104759 RepID=A0ABN8P824_9CNID|nr:unnamed protein product [Porites lobata]